MHYHRRHFRDPSWLPPGKVLRKYPLRMALNFFISDIGSLLPGIISGAEITAVVLSLPTTGPMLLAALKSQDMYLAGSFLMFLALLIVVGVLVSDLALISDAMSRLRADPPASLGGRDVLAFDDLEIVVPKTGGNPPQTAGR